MPISNPPLSDNYQDDNWKQQATEIIRNLEIQVNELQIKIIDLESRVLALE
jgi:hypothetical protein